MTRKRSTLTQLRRALYLSQRSPGAYVKRRTRCKVTRAVFKQSFESAV